MAAQSTRVPFLTLASSMSSDGVVLLSSPDGGYRIERGYPGFDCFCGQDPRGDPRILDALDAAGKLR
jgi:hypothetical protein